MTKIFGKRGLLKIFMFLMVLMVTVSSFLSPTAVNAEAGAEKINTEKIDKFVEHAMNKLNIPGAALGIIKGNQTVYLKGYGFSGPDKSSVTPQTPFVLGSTSKSITALAIMQLVDEGKIDLDAPAQQYLPWFTLADEEASKKILVKHLLYHTSGLSTYDGRLGMVNGNKSIEEHIRSLNNTPLTSPVGSVFQYSNLNYNILSGIVEAVTGEPFTQYVSSHIFKPLDMKHSYGSPAVAKSDGLATGYQSMFGLMVPTKQLDHEATVASGYFISSAEDMSNYLIAQMNSGHFKDKTILSEAGAAQMHQPAAPEGDGSFYAMGWSVKNNVIFHAGSTENTYSFLVMNGDYGIVLLINAMDYILYYDNIIMGIDGILRGQDPSIADIPNFTKTYLIIDLIVIAILAIVARSIYILFKWRARFKATPFRICINIMFILLFNILTPLAIYTYLPKIQGASWSVIRVFLPGLGHVAYALPYLLLCMGAIKSILMYVSLRNRQKIG